MFKEVREDYISCQHSESGIREFWEKGAKYNPKRGNAIKILIHAAEAGYTTPTEFVKYLNALDGKPVKSLRGRGSDTLGPSTVMCKLWLSGYLERYREGKRTVRYVLNEQGLKFLGEVDLTKTFSNPLDIIKVRMQVEG